MVGGEIPAGVAASAAEGAPTATIRDDARASRLLSCKEVFDRIGYGGASPQAVNVLFWLLIQSHPLALFIIGTLNGAKALISVAWSNILTQYAKLSRIPRSWVAAGGIAFGFLFILMSFALLARNASLFAIGFLLSALCIVAHGDLYGAFSQAFLRRERRGAFLRSIATWGVLITAVTMLISGFLVDEFPANGTPISLSTPFGTFALRVYGPLLAFEITALAFILSGYVTSLIRDDRSASTYPFWRFLSEYGRILRAKTAVFWIDARVTTLTAGGVVLSLLQTSLTAYGGIALYRILKDQYPMTPFFALAVVLAIAALAAFAGPSFTRHAHRTTGLAPTIVFGTLLMAILPIALIYKTNVAILAAALCANVIGASVVGFAQGLLTHQLLPDDRRAEYFQAQWVAVIVPYVIGLPILAWIANQSLASLFWIIAGGLVLVVMPLSVALVVIGQRHQAKG